MLEVTVVLPSIGREFYLRRALKGVIDQTLPVNEVVLVLDLKDELEGIERISQEFLIKNIAMKIIYTGGGLGGAASRNIGIKEASNEIIMFLDDDDLWKPAKVECQLKAFHDNPSCVLSHTSRDIVYSSNLNNVVRTVEAGFSGLAFPAILWSNVAGVTSTIAIRKEALFNAGLFDENLPCRQDYDLWIRVSKLGDFIAIKKSLMIYTLFDDGHNQISKNYLNHTLAAKYLINKYSEEFETLNFFHKRKFLSEKWFSTAKSARRTGFFQALPYLIKAFYFFPKPQYMVLLLPNFIYKSLAI